MSGVSILNEQNKTIVFTDLSHLSVDDSPVVMSEAVQVISKYPLKSVLSLVDMTEMRFNKVVIARTTDIARKNAPYVSATAIVGLNSVAKLIAKSVIRLTGRNTCLFDNLEEAKQWLLENPSE
ncbi:hypothetical protein N7E81_00920 [Reichenbachiella carrageenanivorans]|uniref:SpoIIAA-like n=1 Tax=Reichenbachiella carrageenanivorans TaxID=2979869 RepID=A0ABY6D0I2_9BACT|nr:STAS/SEC14 domain-containing protein [Reichenbachiella carrageenanivorans]UXX79672.1 hypothetical protein N7E81_00920 [Reichenbachiella carrageenanivorans]